MMQAMELSCQESNPASVTYELGDAGDVIKLSCVSVSFSAE